MDASGSPSLPTTCHRLDTTYTLTFLMMLTIQVIPLSTLYRVHMLAGVTRMAAGGSERNLIGFG